MAFIFSGESKGDEKGFEILQPVLPTVPLRPNQKLDIQNNRFRNASEYLQYVQQEREKCILTMGSKNSQSSTKNVDYISATNLQNTSVFPTRVKREFLCNFVNAKEQFKSKIPEAKERFPLSKPDHYPHTDDMLAWCAFCLGRHQLSQVMEGSYVKRENEYDCEPEGYPPFLRIVLHLSKGNINHLLSFLSIWLKTLGFSVRQGQWIYALLMIIEKPLAPKLSTALRNLCSSLIEVQKALKSKNLGVRVPIEGFIYILEEHYDCNKDLQDLSEQDKRFFRLGTWQNELSEEESKSDTEKESENDSEEESETSSEGLDESDMEMN